MTDHWLFDERSHAGVDYSSEEVVEDYDNQHTGFRDYGKEAARIIEALALNKDAVLLDMGCGTGGLTMHFARHCRHVFPVDISRAMIEVCRKKAEAKGLANITPVCAGFLTYEHSGENPDAIVSTAALHHLPDFWKLVALKRLHNMLKPGGKFFLFDVVFSFPVDDYQSSLNGWLQNMKHFAGEKMADETVVHIRDEFSTWDWIMESMLERAGFSIDTKGNEGPNMCTYVCTKR